MRNSSSPFITGARGPTAYLSQSLDWSRVATHAEHLLRLQQTFARIAPDYLAKQSRVANYKKGKVIVHAQNGAVAAKLKQLEPSLAAAFCDGGCEVNGVTVRVQVAVHNDPSMAPRNLRSIGPQARLTIRRAAMSMGDSVLGASLLRLAESASESEG